jgi:hypothetical protein
MTTTSTHPRRLLRSTAAVLLGFIAVVILSLGTDQVLHMLHVYPPWGQPMYDPGLNLLALSHRIVYAVIGSYITASLAPHSPMRHVWVGAAIGLVLSTAGAIGAIFVVDLGPAWYPIALVLTALCVACRSSTPQMARIKRPPLRRQRRPRSLHESHEDWRLINADQR